MYSIKQRKTFFFFDLEIKWKQSGITIAGGNGEGSQLDQLWDPRSICIDNDQTIYIVDSKNHRVVEWGLNATIGRVIAGGNGSGNKINQLNYPRDVIIDKENNCLIISDYGNKRVILWSLENGTKNGQVIISNIDYYGLAIDKDGSLYVSDCEKNEVKQWKRLSFGSTQLA